MINNNQWIELNKLLHNVIRFDTPTDVLLSRYFKDNKKLGVKDRHMVAESIYYIVRHYNKLANSYKTNSADMLLYSLINYLKTPHSEIKINYKFDYNAIKQHALNQDIYELPDAVISELLTIYSPAQVRDIDIALSQTAPVTLRTNTYKITRSELSSQLTTAKIEHSNTKYSKLGITLQHKSSLMRNPLFEAGMFEIQDEASQLTGLLFGAKRGEMIVDFCCGAGGKTLLISSMMKNTGRIYAFDINERRLNNLSPRLAKSGLSNISPILINNENDNKVKRLHNKIDRVFIDAPCSGYGTLRRNPDLRFRQLPAQIVELNQIQKSILESASKLVKIGGVVLYATCSILVSENQKVISDFLATHANFELIPASDILELDDFIWVDHNYLILLPNLHQTDGFFACVLRRVK